MEQSSLPQRRFRLTRKTIAAGQPLSSQAIRTWAHTVLQGAQGGQVPQFNALQCFKTLLPRRFGSTFEKLQAHIKKKMKTKYQMSWLRKCRGFLQGSRHQVWIFGRPFRGSDICADQRVDALRRLQVLHLLQVIAGGKRGDLDIGCLCSMIHWAATGRQFRVGVSADHETDQTTRISGRTVMLTFFGPWGDIKLEDAQGVGCLQEPDHLLSKLILLSRVQEIKNALAEFKALADAKSFLTGHSASVELCMETYKAKGILRLHAHVWLLSKQRGQISPCEFDFGLGSDMHKRELQTDLFGTSSRSLSVLMSGCYYVCAPKIGQLFSYSSAKPHADFPVKESWITALYSAGKMTGENAKEQYMLGVSNAKRHCDTVNFIESQRRMQALEQMRKADLASLMLVTCPFVIIPEVEAWKQLFKTRSWRYPFLVLDGPTCNGKTRFAMSMVSPGAAFHCDCSNRNPPDLRNFDRLQHELIVLDELEAAEAIKYKRMLQAGVEMCNLGCSPTQQHTYGVYLSGVQIVVATNNWAQDLVNLSATDSNWLKANSVYHAVLDPLWIDQPLHKGPLDDATIAAMLMDDDGPDF